MTTLFMNRIWRCTSKMLNLLMPFSPLYPVVERTFWSPPLQKAHPPSLDEGPSPVSRTTPMSWLSWHVTKASQSSSTVLGVKALRTSGRLKAMRATPSCTLKVISS